MAAPIDAPITIDDGHIMTLRGPFIPEHNIALFLDVDGTLIEIAETPDAVRVPAALRNTLQLAAAREGGALALISGRPIAVLDKLFAPAAFPAAGMHGLERRNASGKISRPEVNAQTLQSVREALALLTSTRPGLLLEDKDTALAMHYRTAPRYEHEVRAEMQTLAVPLLDRYVLREGKCVIELMPRGYSKRTAIEAFMDEHPFKGRKPVFIGDDVTDEDGFEAVNALQGCSIRVGRSANTAARHRFGSVSAVIAWLRERNLNLHPPGVQRKHSATTEGR